MTTLMPEVRRARLSLMLAHPFLAQAVARYEFVETPPGFMPTLATDGYFIYFDREYVASLQHEQRIGVIAHEVLHCILGHIDRRGNRLPETWNQATDLAVNLLLIDQGFALPSGLYDRAFLGMTAEDIYERLLKKKDAGYTASGFFQSRTDSAIQGNGQPFDRHFSPDDPCLSAIHGGKTPGREERRFIRTGLIAEFKSRLRGEGAGRWNDEISMGSNRSVPWGELLSVFFNGLRQNDYRMFPPNRKHIWQGIYLPSVGVPGPERIVVAVDTSGSMDADLIGKILAEIDRLRGTAECELVLIQCDAAIQEARTFPAFELADLELRRFQVKGRGGTDFKPVFTWIDQNLLMQGKVVDALIYFTDGYGTFPDSNPPYRTLWIMPKTGAAEVRFGQAIKVLQ